MSRAPRLTLSQMAEFATAAPSLATWFFTIVMPFAHLPRSCKLTAK